MPLIRNSGDKLKSKLDNGLGFASSLPSFIVREPKIVGPDQLQSSEADSVNRITSATNVGGILTSVVCGNESWDRRPLVLKGSVVSLTRLCDPKLSNSPDRYNQFLSTLNSWVNLGARLEGGEISQRDNPSKKQIWVRRPYFQKTIIDISFATDEFEEFIRATIGLVKAAHERGLVHGHIVPGNLIYQDYQVALCDPAIAVFTDVYRREYQDLAPELRISSAVTNLTLPTAAADIFGLGIVIRYLLTGLNEPRYQSWLPTLSKMLSNMPHARPALTDIERELFKTSFASSAPDSTGRLITGTIQSTSDTDFGRVESSDRNNAPDVVDRVRSLPTSHSDLSTWLYLLSFALPLVVGGWFYFFRTPAIPADAYWQSEDVELMRQVAEHAVEQDDGAAVDAIVDSAFEKNPSRYINAPLIKVAFDPRWREELDQKDVKAVLSVAVGSLLPRELRILKLNQQLHPGVLFAFLATTDVSAEGQHFKRVKVSELGTLPNPLGEIFLNLESLGIASVEDPVIRGLCHILNDDVSNEALSAYFGSEENDAITLAKLSFLSPYILEKASFGSPLYDFLSSRSGIGRQILEWFVVPSVAGWKDVPKAVKVIIAAEIVPDTSLTFEQRVDLLSFPLESVRNSAVAALVRDKGYERLKDVLLFVADRHSVFSRNGLISLVAAMVGGGDASLSLVAEWLKENPDPAIVVGILLRHQGTPGLDPFQVQASKYLTAHRRELKLTDSELAVLAIHSEPLARALAYSLLDESNPVQRVILEEALLRETHERLKRQLKERLNGR